MSDTHLYRSTSFTTEQANGQLQSSQDLEPPRSSELKQERERTDEVVQTQLDGESGLAHSTIPQYDNPHAEHPSERRSSDEADGVSEGGPPTLNKELQLT